MVNEVTTAVVRRIFEEYVTAGAGLGLIAHQLNVDGVPPPRGTRWDRSTIGNLLDQVAYLGRVKVNGQEFPGQHTPIVDEVVWLRAQAQRQQRRAGKAQGPPPLGTHLLTGGMLRCGECGGTMAPRSPRERQDRYECAVRNRTGGHTLCSMKGVLRADVDGPLLAYLESVVFDLEATRQVIAEEHDRRNAESNALISQAEREVTEAEASLARIEADYTRGAITAEQWLRLQAKLKETHEAAARELEQLTTHAQEFTATAEAFDVDAEATARLALLREAVAGEVTSAKGLAAVRTALSRVFTSITLWRADQDGLLLVPTVRALDELTTWLDLGDGQALSLPRVERIVVPSQKQGCSDRT